MLSCFVFYVSLHMVGILTTVEKEASKVYDSLCSIQGDAHKGLMKDMEDCMFTQWTPFVNSVFRNGFVELPLSVWCLHIHRV